MSPLGETCPPRPRGGGSTMPPFRGPSRQPRRVPAPDRPVMCLRMVLTWQPAPTACLAIWLAYHMSDIRGRRCFSALRWRGSVETVEDDEPEQRQRRMDRGGLTPPPAVS